MKKFLSICLLLPLYACQDMTPTDVVQTDAVQTAGTRITLDDTDGTYTVDLGNGSRQTFKQNNVIEIGRFSFDPAKQTPDAEISVALKASGTLSYAASGDTIQTYLVQFKGQALPAYQAAVQQTGAEIYRFASGQVGIVGMNDTTRAAVEKLDFVRYVGPFYPDYKVSDELTAKITNIAFGIPVARAKAMGPLAAPQVYSVTVHKIGMQAAVINRIINLGGTVHTQGDGSRRITFSIDDHNLAAIIEMPQVADLDTYDGEQEDAEPFLRGIGGADTVEAVAGYNGQGVRVEVRDTDFRFSHENFQNPPVIAHRPHAQSSSSNHGTPSASIMLGSGDYNPDARGIIPGAQGFFRSHKQNASEGITRDDETAELVDPNGDFRVVVQTNSNGTTQTRYYTSVSVELDEVILKHDLLITQSQSNEGNQNSRPRAWAKNVLSVGGLCGNGTLDRTDDTWRGCRSSAASHGPAADGRIKPDLANEYGAQPAARDNSDSTYRTHCCTSQATPATGGYAGLFFQMWADGIFDGGPGLNREVFNVRPHAQTVKALMIHTAVDNAYNEPEMTRFRVGWGQPNAKNAHDLAQYYNWSLPILIDESAVLEPLAVHQYSLTVVEGDPNPLKVTLVYKDPAGTAGNNRTPDRVNDLSLRLTSPSGVAYWGNNGLTTGNWSTPGGVSDTINTVENVFIQAAELGTWTVEVLGHEIVQDTHTATGEIDAVYALIGSGGTSALPANQAPITNAGADGSVQIPNAVHLNGSVADDNFAGNPLTVSWSKVSGPGIVSFGNASSTTTTASFSTAGTYTLRLTANDREFIDFDDTVISVAAAPANQAPVVSAGADQTLTLPASASLNGSVSDDGLPVGTPVTSTWSKVSGPGTVNFGNASSTTTTASFSTAGTYTLRLTANDGELQTSDTVTITVAPPLPNKPPTAYAGPDIDAAAINSDTQLNGSATDDGKPNPPAAVTATWSKVSGPGSVSFSDANNLTSTASFSAAGTYVLRLSVSDGELSAQDDLRVTVVNESVLEENTAGGDKMDVKPGQSGAQSFQHGSAGDADYQITTLVLYLSREQEAPSSDLSVTIGTGINSGELANSAVAIPATDIDSSAGSSFTRYEISYPTPVGPLTAGTTYYINLENDAANIKAYYLEYSGGNTYPRGTYYKSGSDDGKDSRFQISGAPVGVTPVNNPPAFMLNPIIKAVATENSAYQGSLSADATDPDGDALSFAKVSGPAWLQVAADGTLSGTPGAGDVGQNDFVVQATDATGLSDGAALRITVDAFEENTSGGGGAFSLLEILFLLPIVLVATFRKGQE